MKCQGLVSVNKGSSSKRRSQHPQVRIGNNQYLSLHTIKGRYVYLLLLYFFFQMYMHNPLLGLQDTFCFFA